MKKVLIYSHYFYPSIGGVERFTELLANGLSEKFDITVMTKTVLPSNQCEHKNLYHIIRKNNLKYKEKPDVDMVVISGYSVKMIIYSWLWGIPSIVIHHNDLINCTNGTGFHKGHFCHHQKIDCLKYDLQLEGWVRALKKQLNLITKKTISLFPKKHVFVSEWLRKVTRLKGEVIYNCVDNTFRTSSVNNKKMQIIFAGRLVDIKGCDMLLRAYSRANLSMPLIVCGDGPDRIMLENLTKELGLTAKVVFKGALSKEELAMEMNLAKVCVVPSINEEPFGLVAIEAAAAKCIVLGRNLGGLAEVCEKVGYTFSTEKELVKLMQDVEANKLLEKSDMVDYFNCHRMIDAYVRVVERETTKIISVTTEYETVAKK